MFDAASMYMQYMYCAHKRHLLKRHLTRHLKRHLKKGHLEKAQACWCLFCRMCMSLLCVSMVLPEPGIRLGACAIKIAGTNTSLSPSCERFAPFHLFSRRERAKCLQMSFCYCLHSAFPFAYLYAYTLSQLRVFKHTRANEHSRTRTRTERTHTGIHIHIYIYAYVCIHICIHTHICIYIYIYMMMIAFIITLGEIM